MKLWEKGMLSNETLLQAYGYDMGQEVERRKTEDAKGVSDALTPRATNNKTTTGDGGDTAVGRPTMDDSERHSDPAKSVTGRQPKGSNPEGSEAQTE